jgi:regulator of sigma E protease
MIVSIFNHPYTHANYERNFMTFSLGYLVSLGISFLGLSILIALHELGHFIMCRIFNIPVPTFSIGFGPVLISKFWRGTNFVISAIPLGGFVEIAGSDPDDPTSISPKNFMQRPYIQKLLVMLGGIIANIAICYVLLWAIFMAGAPASGLLSPATATSTIAAVKEQGLADSMGLRVGDELSMITVQDGADTTIYGELDQHPQRILPGLLHARRADRAHIALRRAHEQMVIATPERASDTTRPLFGISFHHVALPAASIAHAAHLAANQLMAWCQTTGQFLWNLFGKPSLDGLGGPLSIIVGGSQGAREGAWVFLAYLALISINLAIINFVPLPVFDGGQILIATIEAVIGKPLGDYARRILMIGTWVTLIGLFIIITLKDISRLIW